MTRAILLDGPPADDLGVVLCAILVVGSLAFLSWLVRQ